MDKSHERGSGISNRFFRQMSEASNVIEAPQLHAFSDGGDEAFGTCIFIRWVTTEGVQLRFVAAKAFVAPLKRKSIPKVELMGVIAMSRLTTEIVDALGLTFMFIRFWIDSEVVLYWLFSESCLYKPFVSTRVHNSRNTSGVEEGAAICAK